MIFIINFVIGNKQIFITYFAVDIKEYALKMQNKEYLQPAAQCLVLYHLKKENSNQFNYNQLASALKCKHLTNHKAMEYLQTLALCKVGGTNEKIIFFETVKTGPWGKETPFKRSRGVKNLFIDD